MAAIVRVEDVVKAVRARGAIQRHTYGYDPVGVRATTEDTECGRRLQLSRGRLDGSNLGCFRRFASKQYDKPVHCLLLAFGMDQDPACIVAHPAPQFEPTSQASDGARVRSACLCSRHIHRQALRAVSRAP